MSMCTAGHVHERLSASEADMIASILLLILLQLEGMVASKLHEPFCFSWQ